MTNIEQLIADFQTRNQEKQSKNIFLGEDIPSDLLAFHKKAYAKLENDEKPLLLLNKQSLIKWWTYGFTGLLITGKGIHYKVCRMRNLIITDFPFYYPCKIEWQKVNILEFAEQNVTLKKQYEGHEFYINGENAGMIRMGYSLAVDVKALDYLNSLFDYLAEKGVLKENQNKHKTSSDLGEVAKDILDKILS
jgi:hypothetical protein